jgi:hypothetical protein
LVLSAADWQQIDALINGEWTHSEISLIMQRLINQQVVAVEKILTGGNSGVYRIELPKQSVMRLKIYSVDAEHDRLSSEFTATKAIFGLGKNHVSQPLAKDDELGVGCYVWIDGTHVLMPGHCEIESTLKFLSALHEVRNSDQFASLGLASAACLSGRDIEIQIKHRFCQFDLSRKHYPELNYFLSRLFLPTFEKLLVWAQDNWPDGYGFDAPIDKAQQTLSPSDFGFHNIIRRPDGSLAFLDFEYFGWDDPVKLMSDFVFHQGMTLAKEQKSLWLNGALSLYGRQFSKRLKVCSPMYGLIWCLILLNDFRSEVWYRRSLANNSERHDKQKILNHQLARAESLLREIAVGYADLFVRIND